MPDIPLEVQCTASSAELVVSLSPPLVSAIARNLVGLPTVCTGKTKEHHKHDSDDEDSEERKNKAMDRLHKVSGYDFGMQIVHFVMYTHFCELE